MSKDKPISRGAYIKDSEDVYIGGIETQGMDIALATEDSKRIKVGYIKASSLPKEDFEKIKNAILQEVEEILQETKKDKKSDRTEKLFQFISAVGSASLVELLKSYGMFPSQE